MSIASEISRISGNVADAYTAANAKGATMPVSQNSDNLATTISTIPSGITPTGTKSITANGVYDVTNFASADVNVPTTAPEIYRAFRVNNGKIENSISTPFIPLPGTATDISDYCYVNAYRNTPASVLSGAINLSSLTTLTGISACYYMFTSCTGITSVDLSSLTTVSASNACSNMFQYCTGITSIDLSSLTTISGSNACRFMFQGCTGLTSVDLSSLTIISNTSSCNYMFSDCTGLTNVNLSGLTTINNTSGAANMFQFCSGITSMDLSGLTTLSGSQACQSMFQDCTGLTSVNLSGLITLTGRNAFQYMFQSCTSLATVYIGGTTAIDFGTLQNQFSNMFLGCSQNIDVYAPAANQSQIEAFSGYPNFGGTGTVTWHWRS